MLEQIANRTRTEWELFDYYKGQAFQQSEQEIQNRETQEMENIINITKEYLNLYWIIFLWNETNFTTLYTKYIKWDGTANNVDMKERIWNETELNRILQDRIENNNNIKDFCEFIISYEQ